MNNLDPYGLWDPHEDWDPDENWMPATWVIQVTLAMLAATLAAALT
jgi:hypothetical protein